MKRKPTRGGARPGAGRPTTTGRGADSPVSFRLSTVERARVEDAARERGQAIGAMARAALLASVGG